MALYDHGPGWWRRPAPTIASLLRAALSAGRPRMDPSAEETTRFGWESTLWRALVCLESYEVRGRPADSFVRNVRNFWGTAKPVLDAARFDDGPLRTPGDDVEAARAALRQLLEWPCPERLEGDEDVRALLTRHEPSFQWGVAKNEGDEEGFLWLNEGGRVLVLTTLEPRAPVWCV